MILCNFCVEINYPNQYVTIGTIHYDEFLNMMLGKRSTILKL